MGQVRVSGRRDVRGEGEGEMRRLEPCCDERGPPGTLTPPSQRTPRPNTCSVYTSDGTMLVAGDS